ncbi:hypothetical protein SAMN04487768_0369 [Burkholderia sp. b13]|nr:hypothetical protein SAMN04487768_0369 [Burkholderia sp. b13]
MNVVQLHRQTQIFDGLNNSKKLAFFKKWPIVILNLLIQPPIAQLGMVFAHKQNHVMK